MVLGNGIIQHKLLFASLFSLLVSNPNSTPMFKAPSIQSLTHHSPPFHVHDMHTNLFLTWFEDNLREGGIGNILLGQEVITQIQRILFPTCLMG